MRKARKMGAMSALVLLALCAAAGLIWWRIARMQGFRAPERDAVFLRRIESTLGRG